MSARTFLPGCLSAPAFNRLTPQARRGGTLSDRIEQGSFVEARGRPWLVEVVDDLEHRQWLHLRSCRPSMTRRSGFGRFGRDVCLWRIADYFRRPAECLLSGVKRTLFMQPDMSANDPKLTLVAISFRNSRYNSVILDIAARTNFEGYPRSRPRCCGRRTAWPRRAISTPAGTKTSAWYRTL